MRKKSQRTSAKATIRDACSRRSRTKVRRIHCGGATFWKVVTSGVMGIVTVIDDRGKTRGAYQSMDRVLTALCRALCELDEYKAIEEAVIKRRQDEAARDSLPIATVDWFDGKPMWAIFTRFNPPAVLARAKTIAGLRKSAQSYCNRTGNTLRFVWENDSTIETIQSKKGKT